MKLVFDFTSYKLFYKLQVVLAANANIIFSREDGSNSVKRRSELRIVKL